MIGANVQGTCLLESIDVARNMYELTLASCTHNNIWPG